ncbi:MAG: hypothetical protein HY304_04005, partial [candidate division Zixibacteria bacterium]|nr:hypothetical protein [candidate division Zixibacteria bacterium]
MKWLERRILGKTVEQLLSVTLALVALGSLVYWIPIWQTRDLVGPLQSQEVLELQNKLRATWAQVLGGGLLLIGLYFTWKQVQIAREHQITERFTRAVD